MYSQISTLAFVGIEARPIEVQVRITPGSPAFSIVGLPDKAVAESRERVRNALHAVGLGLPYKHLTVNLAPADLPKEGSHFDLPIVLGLMVAMGAIAPDALAGYAAIGELALDGSIRAVPGALPAAIGANALGKGLICPAACGPEAAWAGEDVDILSAPHLLSLVNHFTPTHILAGPEASAAILTMDHLSNVLLFDFAKTGKLPTPLGMKLVPMPDQPEDRITILDAGYAAQKLTEQELLLENDKLIHQQWDRAYLTVVTDFAILYERARVVLSNAA